MAPGRCSSEGASAPNESGAASWATHFVWIWGRSELGVRDGVQRSAIPVVPWAQLITGQPPRGGLPRGMTTVPETAMGRPLTEVER